MDIFTLDLSEKKVKVNEKLSFIVDYPTVEQKFKLEKAVLTGVNIPPPVKDGQIDYENVTPEMLQQYSAAEKYRKALYLKYTIKGWKGKLFSENDKAIIENNELNDAQWTAICYNEELVSRLYELFDKKLRWNETDKKKFISTEDSGSKEG